MQKLIECIPNFSEGRRKDVIDRVAGAVRGVAGVRLLDAAPNADHNRTVLTFVGPPDAVAEAAFAATAEAVRLINMEQHKGEHPRIGAMDVVPFVPMTGMTMEETVALANRVGKRIADELGVPVYMYASAATTPTRKRLPDVRQGQYEGLKESITAPERKPDYGEARMHLTAGATAVGSATSTHCLQRQPGDHKSGYRQEHRKGIAREQRRPGECAGYGCRPGGRGRGAGLDEPVGLHQHSHPPGV